jgi:hypothetical protein
MRNKGSINVPDGVPVDSVEEGVRLDLLDRKTRFGVGKKSRYGKRISWIPRIRSISPTAGLPSDHTLGFSAEIDVFGDLQVILPLDDLLVSLMRALRTEWRVA